MRFFQIVAIAIMSVALFAGCKPVEDVMLDSFEGTIDKTTVDFGAAQGSTIKVTADQDQKVCGNQSLKIVYILRPSGYMWIARGYGLDVKGAGQWQVSPQQVPWRKYNALSIQMKGRGTGAVVAFDVKDAGGELWRFLLDDDFTGWKEIVCPFKEFFVRSDWQPEKAELNKKIDFPIMSFQFEPRLPGKGRYNFDCVKVVRRKL